MGIPSYFSYIIKNHSSIIRTLAQLRANNATMSSLYMDCNSIIYDAVRSMETEVWSESCLIDKVIAKIRYYVDMIRPSNVLYIAFDGVAPFAKMDQQRQRREPFH